VTSRTDVGGGSTPAVRRPLWRARGVAALAVLGPGLLAGLSDDDPAGITTYSVLGTDHGYRLLWVLLLSTVALMVFHDLGSRMGVVTGQGLIGLIRHRYGVRVGTAALVTLVLANIGTAAAEYAGIAAGSELLGVSRYASVPVAALSVTVLVLLGSFHRVEHWLLALAAVFVAYVGAGLLAHPDWHAALTGLLVPRMGFSHTETLLVAATVGTTLAPWGLSFIQSYAVDKKLTVTDLRYERVDVLTGAALTGVIGFFVVVACAETLHARGEHIDSAADAAQALTPVAGDLAGTLFAVGLIGAALLAAAILPLSTAYSICDLTGSQAALDSSFREARLFYLSDVAVTVVAAGLVLLPQVPLMTLLVSTQTLNAVLLVPLLGAMQLLSRDHDVLGAHVVTRWTAAAQLLVLTGVIASVVVLLA
jgi:Mn2+/Fe2+ NRAMP family transporter